MGLLQCHYPYMQTWYEGMGPFKSEVGDTVPDAQIKAAAAFLNHNMPLYPLDLVIQAQNLGIGAIKAGGRNPDYLAKWSQFYQQLRGAT